MEPTWFPPAGAVRRWKKSVPQVDARRVRWQPPTSRTANPSTPCATTSLLAFGRVDILVNAAGYTLKKPALEISEAEWSAVFDTNLNGALRACQVFYEPLKQSGRGRVINIASLGSFLAFHEVAAYCATKTALLSLTRSLACEWARDGISVNAIAPGVFPTELNKAHHNGNGTRQRNADAHAHGAASASRKNWWARRSCWRPTAPVSSPGQCIAVDGGYLASGVNS